MKSYFYLSRKRKNAKGQSPIYCRVTHEQERVDFSTKFFVTEAEWDKLGWERIHRSRIADRLTILQKKIDAIIARCEDENIYSSAEVVSRLKEQQRPQVLCLQEITLEYLDLINPTQLVRERTERAARQWVELIGHSFIRKIVPDDIKAFENWQIEQEYSIETAVKKIALLKRVFRYAEHKKYIHTNPYGLYKFPRIPKSDPVQLEQSELTALEQKHFAQSALNKVKDLFLFQCYTGLSYGDLEMFGPGSVNALPDIKLLKGKRVKTGEEFTVPWIPEAAAIAEKYNYRLPVMTNQRYNYYLKEIAAILEIEKTLTTHVGRRTFSQVMIDKGYSGEAVSRMMGHANFTITQKYYGRIGDVRVINEAMKMVG